MAKLTWPENSIKPRLEVELFARSGRLTGTPRNAMPDKAWPRAERMKFRVATFWLLRSIRRRRYSTKLLHVVYQNDIDSAIHILGSLIISPDSQIYTALVTRM